MPKYYDFMNTYNAHLWLLTVPKGGHCCFFHHYFSLRNIAEQIIG